MKIKPLIIASLFTVASFASASSPATLHKGAIAAESPEYLKKAYDLLFDNDSEALSKLAMAEIITPPQQQENRIQVDDVHVGFGDQWIKFHVKGHTTEMYARLEDVTLDRPDGK
jgi:hypothetical protein